MSHCSKPGCGGTAAAVLSYDYAAKTAVLEDPRDSMPDPHVYVLCAACADKLTPPRGWDLADGRQAPPLFLPRDPATRTIAVHEVVGDDIEDVVEDATASSRQLFFGHSVPGRA